MSRRLNVLVAFAILITVVTAGTGTTASSSTAAGPPEPSTGALFGAYVNPDSLMPGTNAPVSYQWDATNALEQKVGRKLDILQFFWSWNDAFPDAEFEGWAINHGATPLISWHGTALQPILDGQHDAWIRARARGVKALNAPVFIRWAWEMNGNWYPWDGYNNGANLAATEKYKAAWRRIHDLFRQEGATNVSWVWAPNYASIPNTRDNGPGASWNHFLNYYPGDAYVDWVGIDAYNAGYWLSWNDMLKNPTLPSIYNHFAGKKPIMMAETASQEASEGENVPAGATKATWIADTHRVLKAEYPGIDAFVWYHVKWGGRDFRADSSPSALTSFKAMAQDPYFNPSAPPPAPPPPGPPAPPPPPTPPAPPPPPTPPAPPAPPPPPTPPAPPAPPNPGSGFSVRLLLDPAATTLTGRVSWTARTSSNAERVEFQIDGRTRWIEYVAPFVYRGDGATLNPGMMSAGTHRLTVRAVDAEGRVARDHVTVQVKTVRALQRVSGSAKRQTRARCKQSQAAKPTPARPKAKACRARP